MKNNIKNLFLTFFICLVSGVAFIGVGYFYLADNGNRSASGEASKIEYYSSVPQNAGVMFDIGGSKTLFHLDFEREVLSVIFVDIPLHENSIYGYSIDYTVEGDYNLLAGIIDIAGGIDLEVDGELLCCTGLQTVDILTTTPDNLELKREIIQKIIKNLGKNGFQNQDFLYIIENSETELSVPDCYFWDAYVKALCKNARIIN